MSRTYPIWNGKKSPRYGAMDRHGNMLAWGTKLDDVERFAPDGRIILDYRLKRYAFQPIYPPTYLPWRYDWTNLGNIIRNA